MLNQMIMHLKTKMFDQIWILHCIDWSIVSRKIKSCALLFCRAKQNAVTAYLTSIQILPAAFSEMLSIASMAVLLQKIHI